MPTSILDAQPTAADYAKIGAKPLAPDLKARIAKVPLKEADPMVAVPAWVTAFADELIKEGLDSLAAYIKKQIFEPDVTWVSKSGFYVPHEEHLYVYCGNVDDVAEVLLNNEVLGNFAYGHPGAWVIVPHIKPGLNALVVKVKNTGDAMQPPGKWSVDVQMKRVSTGQLIPQGCYSERGDDMMWPNRSRVFITRFWGQ